MGRKKIEQILLITGSSAMKKNQFTKTMAVAAGFVFLCVVAGMTLAQSAPPVAVQTPNAAPSGIQPRGKTLPPNDFADLSFTDDQKAELDKIHRETESRKAAVEKDQQLTPDQKNAMLLGYTRMEYGQSYKVLSPEQRRQVNRRMLARKASDQAAQKKQLTRN
jgi:Spy/CpxP family protein refolding chaperone